MTTIMKISSRNLADVRRRRLVKGGMAAILATGLAPTFARAEAKKLVMAHIVPPPESGAVAFAWQAEEVRKRSNGELDMQFFGGTLLSKELEIMNAVKSGNIQIGDPAGAAATIFPEMGVFLVPYLVQSYDHAYKMFNGKIGDSLDKIFQEKYKLKTLCFFDYGFRHFWTSKKPIVEPKDLRGAKIRVQLAKVFADTINGLGGSAVPMAWGDVITAAKSGVIDGGDLPIVNQVALKIYEVSKYCSMTFHNYGPTLNTMNLAAWEGLSDAHKKLMLDTSREAQEKVRQLTESVDNFAAAKAALEPKGMTVVEAKVEEFKKVAQQKIWPTYKSQFGDLWDQIEGVKA
jgi:tripartite ATP-independent transporter DctP family solute receptor